jgi:AraC-like DNA-binding protein
MCHGFTMRTRPVSAQRLRDLALLRRVRDRIDRDYAQPLDVEALARDVHMSAGHLSRYPIWSGPSPCTRRQQPQDALGVDPGEEPQRDLGVVRMNRPDSRGVDQLESGREQVVLELDPG